MPSPRTFVLVVAAGSGQRFGGELPKQYQTLAGKPMLRHGLQEMHGTRIHTPRSPDDRPDRERLEMRYQEFLSAA